MPRHKMLKRCNVGNQFFSDPNFTVNNADEVGGGTVCGLLLWGKRVIELYSKTRS
jgi:hypothetical protein